MQDSLCEIQVIQQIYIFSASALNFNIYKLWVIPIGDKKKKRELEGGA